MSLKDLVIDGAEAHAIRIACKYDGYLFPHQTKQLIKDIAAAIRYDGTQSARILKRQKKAGR